MASTTFVDGETLIEASWLNDVNAAVYTPGTTTAADIANVPAGNIIATDVQAAINELDTEKQPVDALLIALAAQTTAANNVQAYSGVDTPTLLSTGTANGNIPLVGTESATTTVPGLVRKSTQAENAAGTGTGVVAAADLPAAVAASFSGTNQSTAANGYQKLPGGIIIQWGTSAAIGGGSNAVQTFPVAFPAGLLSVSSVPLNAGSTHYISGTSTTQFTLYNTSGAVSAFGWIAIGH